MREYIEIGKIINTHGVAGMVKADPWCDTPGALAKIKTVYRLRGGSYEPLSIKRSAVQGRFVLLHFEGFESFDDAVSIKNEVIYANRGDIPLKKGAVLIDDLKGLPVIDSKSGRIYGTLSDVLNLGASDIYEIKTENGTAMLPAVKEFIDRIDLEKGIFVSPIPGFFEDEN